MHSSVSQRLFCWNKEEDGTIEGCKSFLDRFPKDIDRTID